MRVRTKRGTTPPLPSIEPGASAAVDADIETGPAAPFAEGNADPASRYARDPSAVTPAVLWQVAGDLAAGRSRRIDELLNRDQFVCVYAEAAPPDPPAVLRGAGDVAAGRKHYELIRAVARVTARGCNRPQPLRGSAAFPGRSGTSEVPKIDWRPRGGPGNLNRGGGG